MVVSWQVGTYHLKTEKEFPQISDGSIAQVCFISTS